MKNLSISEVSQKFNITNSTIRYYEKVGILSDIPRDTGGRRYFDNNIIEWLEMILCLRASGVSIEALIKYADLVRLGEGTIFERIALLSEQRENLQNQKNQLDRSLQKLNHKIEFYSLKI
ncbi:MerR family transcriptional regulator [Leuconostoc sp. JNUCC 76]